MNIIEVKNAVIKRQKMVWNDPDPIEGNDYTVQKIWKINKETAIITYNDGASDAEVYLSELKLADIKEEMLKVIHQYNEGWIDEERLERDLRKLFNN
jgi:hypothetical protein